MHRIKNGRSGWLRSGESLDIFIDILEEDFLDKQILTEIDERAEEVSLADQLNFFILLLTNYNNKLFDRNVLLLLKV